MERREEWQGYRERNLHVVELLSVLSISHSSTNEHVKFVNHFSLHLHNTYVVCSEKTKSEGVAKLFWVAIRQHSHAAWRHEKLTKWKFFLYFHSFSIMS